MCESPPRSPTIVGSAVETIVWSSAAISMTSISPAKTTITLRPSRWVGATAAAVLTGGSYARLASRLARRGFRTRAPNARLQTFGEQEGHVANFERRGVALDRGGKRRATSSRFGEFSDRVARAFAG